MRIALGRMLLGILACSVVTSGDVALGADAAAAERQFRVARRLAAEGSAEAVVALRKVVELDPGGALADDAWIELAKLDSPPRWPEELGRIDAAAVTRALEMASKAAEISSADRGPEATYYRGLLKLEPTTSFDASSARYDLLSVATHPVASDWARSARYAVGWLAEQDGDYSRALAAYQRLVVDGASGHAAARAQLGSARVLLRLDDPAAAAQRLENALQLGIEDAVQAQELKELAVRSLLGRHPLPPDAPIVHGTEIRSAAGFAVSAVGAVIADRKEDAVRLVAPDGGLLHSWMLDEVPTAVAINDLGNAYAAAGGSIWKLDVDRPARRLVGLDDYEELADLAVDNLGGFWLLDRPGERVGRIEPGGRAIRTIWEGRGLSALCWNGRRVAAIDGREKRVVLFDGSGAAEELVTSGLLRPADLAADRQGNFAVLDTKAGDVKFYDATGKSMGAIDYRSAGVEKPSALAVRAGGGLQLFDDATGSWVGWP